MKREKRSPYKNLLKILNTFNQGLVAAPTKSHHRSLSSDASDPKTILPNFVGDGSGEPEVASPVENPSAERPNFCPQIRRRWGAPPRVCAVEVCSRHLIPSLRFSSPQISSPGIVGDSFQEPVWDPCVLKIRTKIGEAVASRRKLFGGPSLTSFRPGSFLVSPSQRDEILAFFSPQFQNSSFLGFGALEVLGMEILKTKLRKVYSGLTKDYYQKGTNII